MTATVSPTLARVARGDLCSGCGLCAGVAPEAIAIARESGFARPRQRAPITSEAESAIAKACPGSTVAPWPVAPVNHPYWGPAFRVLGGHATDDRVRFAGSSGGALTAIALHALAHGRAEQVLHVTADPDRPTGNVIRLSRTAEEVIAGAGSRYAASSPLEGIARLLDAGTPTVFIGKPCDVSALRQLGRIDPRVDRVFPLKLAFFCAGVPSASGADAVVRAMGLDPRDLTAFRYRGHGWPGLTRAETRDGAVGEMRYADSWGGHLSKHVQFRCKICPDGVGGVADIAAADAWYGGETGYPEFEERDGRSLIISRTETGDAWLNDAIRDGVIVAEPIAIDEIDLMQPAQARRKRVLAARLAALRTMGRPVPRMDRLAIAKAARRSTPAELARNWAGLVKRLIQRRNP